MIIVSISFRRRKRSGTAACTKELCLKFTNQEEKLTLSTNNPPFSGLTDSNRGDLRSTPAGTS